MAFSDTYVFDAGLGPLVDEFAADRDALRRRYPLSRSEARIDRMARHLRDWQMRADEIDYEALSQPAKIDLTLLRLYVLRSLHNLGLDREERIRLDQLLPFGPDIVALEEARISMADLDPRDAAKRLVALGERMKGVESVHNDAPGSKWLGELREAMDRWKAFYGGYDPVLDWWIREPLQRVSAEFERLGKPPAEEGPIPGRPLGREALLEDLALELLPYSPEELIAIGEREYSWCLEEMLKASRELGYGDDWKAALEYVKDTCLPPGAQPAMVRDFALEAIDYVSDLVTVPELAKETWRMQMMSPERQKTSPFFLGGESIIVSYPTDAMQHHEKLMSMRGNNPNFSHATVQHELIPGHHLQFYMTARHRKYRRLFSTPFWIEGWTLYWELLLWDLGFPRTPEERIGMLFWRMHRCVRVSFSLRFHLGELTTEECVSILVDRVGHERANAEGEVRRSFGGIHPPLYQAAYMIGGLQFRALSREIVDGGKLTLREFHDAIMHENEMPPAVLRLALLGQAPPAAGPAAWRFD